MIIRLLNIQFARLKRQKILYLFFIVMAVIIISNALQEDSGTANFAAGYYAGGKFPTMCMQSYIDIVGTLFLSFISAVLICGEKASGMFRQPLLNGVSKKQLLIAKTVSIFTVALICFFVCDNRQHCNRFLFMGQSYLRSCTGIFVTNVVIGFSADNNGSVFSAFILVYVEYIQYDVRFSYNFISQ